VELVEVVPNVLPVKDRLVGALHRALGEVDHVFEEVPRVDDPRPLFEPFADEVGLELGGTEQLERGGPDLARVPVVDVLLGAADRAAGVRDVVDDQDVFSPSTLPSGIG